MATLSDILNLNMTKASINKIDLFLEISEKNSYEYISALCYQAEIMDFLGNTNEALERVYKCVPNIDKMENRTIIALFNAIIKICSNCERYDQVMKYIELKKQYLPVSGQSAYCKDKINLYLKMKDYPKAREAIDEYLNDDISKEEAIAAKESLAGILYYERDFDKYLELIPTLDAYYKENLMLDKLLVLHYNHLYIDYTNGKYTKIIFEGNEFMNEAKENVLYSLKCAVLMIKSYLECNNTKKASILVSDFDEIVGENYLDDSIDFLYAAKAVYARLANTQAIIEYTDRIEKLERIKNPPVTKAEKKKEEKQIKKLPAEEIVIPIIELPKAKTEEIEMPEVTYRHDVLNPMPKEEIIQTQEVVKKINSTKTVEVFPEFKTLEKVLDAINDKNTDVKFREIFRMTCLSMAKSLKIDEVYLLYERKGFFGIQYKKERAYDKKLNVEMMENTVNYTAYLQNTESFTDDTDKTYNRNIVNGEEYGEGITAYAFPLTNELGPIGSIAYIGTGDFLTEGLTYETLKIITSLINTRLIVYLDQEKLIADNSRRFFLIDNMVSGIKEEKDGYIHINETGCHILGTLPDLRDEDFLYHIEKEDQPKYRNFVSDISSSIDNGRSIEYRYKNEDKTVYVKETFYPSIVDGDLWLTSLIEDRTDVREKELALADLAYKNPVSNMFTEVKLIDDLARAIRTEKMALAIIEIQDFKIFSEIYGYSLPAQMEKAVGIELNKAMENDFKFKAYHLERERFAILMQDVVDKRAVEKKLYEILGNITDGIYKRNARLNVYFNAGYMTIGKGKGDTSTETVLNNALDALNDTYTMDMHQNNIAQYNSDLNKARFLENEKVNAISEALDTSKIALYYQQIVDLKDNSVMGYYIKASHESYEIEYEVMEKVARRKNLMKRFDKYVIENTFRELKMMKDNLNGYIDLYVPVHAESFDGSMAGFILTRLKYYKIRPEKVILIAEDTSNTEFLNIKSIGVRIATRNPLNLYSGVPSVLFYDYHQATFDSVNDLAYIASKYNATLILDEINTKEEVEACISKKYRYIYGSRFRSVIKIKDLLNKLKSA